MKVLLLSVLTTASLLAIEATIKYDEVTLSIDGTEHTYQKGKHFTVEYNQEICFLKGDGVVNFSDEKAGLNKQLDEDSKCTTMTKTVQPKGRGLLATILKLPPKTNEEVADGAGRRANDEVEKVSGDIELKKEVKEIVLEDESWGPLPVTFKLFDEKGNEVKVEVNKENLTTKFSLSREEVKDGYRVEVTNRLDDKLVDIKFTVEKK